MSDAIKQLCELMAKLRDPNEGCAWDRAQTMRSISPYTIEEAYEVVDAIASENWAAVKDELADLLFHLIYYSQIAKEEQLFNFDDIAEHLAEKIVRRHPQVFANKAGNKLSPEEVIGAWEKVKSKERQQQQVEGILSGVARFVPALMRAQKLQKRAASVGYDWTSIEPIYEKLNEEIEEFKLAMLNQDEGHAEEELGDILFSAVNLGRFAKFDCESALRKANDKFAGRFEAMEALAKERNQSFAELDIQEMEALWQEVKANEQVIL